MDTVSKPSKKGRWLIYIGTAIVLLAGPTVVLEFFPDEEREFRREVRNVVEKTFPQQAAKVAKSFGLTYFGEESAVSAKISPAAHSVVLIHGLDDPMISRS